MSERLDQVEAILARLAERQDRTQVQLGRLTKRQDQFQQELEIASRDGRAAINEMAADVIR